jgi:hypothetical protein
MLRKNLMTLVKCDNPFPDCLYMKLQGEQITDSFQYFSLLRNIKKMKLKLTVRFGEQQIQIGESTARFGIKGGELRLKLINSKLLFETLNLTPPFSTAFDVERQAEEGKENEISGSIGIKLGAEAKTKEISKETSKIKERIYQVYSKGTEEEPIWIFEVKTNELFLMGILKSETIGTLDIHNKPCLVEARFTVRNEDDIYPIEFVGNWIKDEKLIRPKGLLLAIYGKKKVIPSWIKIKQQLKLYISRVELNI